MPTNRPTITYLGVDVGTVRIGVARGASDVAIAMPLVTVEADSGAIDHIVQLASEYQVQTVVVGLPRSQSGELSAQTAISRQFGEGLVRRGLGVVYQDESLSSVRAEEYLRSSGTPYTKADVDAKAAALILGDFLESPHD